MPGRSAPPIAINPFELINALPDPILALAGGGQVLDVNAAAEVFFDMGRSALLRRNVKDIAPFGSPLLSLYEQVQSTGVAIHEHRISLGGVRSEGERIVDVHVGPLPGIAHGVVILLKERTIADKIDRQLTHRGAARSVSAMAAMLAHEIKNPLSGIRGAAQLLETAVSDQDRALTRLIQDETDRIVGLVDRMDIFSDDRPLQRESLNIHAVLDHVKRLAQAGFGRQTRFVENYDPSLPPVFGNRHQLIQVFLNLVKNAVEAHGSGAADSEVEISTAFRHGVRLKTPNSPAPVSLPLEICVRDNGPGVPPDIAANLFEPFVSSKANGTGLGLALVAKVIGDHGGIVECVSHPRRTLFRVLLPMHSSRDGRGEAGASSGGDT